MSNQNGNGLTITKMMSGRANSGTAQVPTQTFYASNIAGTTVPKVGSAQAASMGGASAGSMAGVTPMQIAIFVLIIIGGGYLLHHLSFEEGVKVG
jgi:hypothetical protein